MSLTQMRQKTAPLRDIIEGFFRSNYDLSPKTATWYRQNLEDFVTFVEKAQGREPVLSDIDKGYVDAFLKERIAKPTCKYPKGSPFAARAASTTLKRFANYLASEGILADKFGTSVLKHVRRTRVDDDVRQPLSDVQLERILDAAGRPGDRDRAIMVLLAGSGLRANEAREARVSDLDLDHGTFRVRPETSKFGRERVVYLHPAVTKELDRYLRYRRSEAIPESPLFPTRTGETFDEDGWAKVFMRLKRRSGIRGFSAHVLRHTWATNFMKTDGANLLELKRQGGWERWEMVERYSHAIPVKDRRLLPNPLEPSHKTAFGQQPSARISRLRFVDH
jgi:integrase/recombinase XerD